LPPLRSVARAAGPGRRADRVRLADPRVRSLALSAPHLSSSEYKAVELGFGRKCQGAGGPCTILCRMLLVIRSRTDDSGTGPSSQVTGKSLNASGHTYDDASNMMFFPFTGSSNTALAIRCFP